MATLVRKDFEDRIKNDTFDSVKFTIQDNLGAAIDLTGVTIDIDFRYRCKTGTVVKSFSTTLSAGITLTTPLSGIFHLDAYTPITLEVGEYYYDAQITFTDGRIKTYVWGIFNVLQDIT
jgi:hypothetical protein